ncbi:DNA-binding HxlR family transcriptional regulator [Variovorax boronicumulans]|uniref:DNA-binding HxlR family transcriptional regulator n=1 Tax=Variovorax boronicumulans TaxID=436515 RepID=A0AAW8CWL3_9BURK|nr:helix-turn-helix domain-containing protein [Variovorax boronicumulans]MDP9892619.1 DNA-binding HxlR family transcriptional regulator [Variovorax boronicumulans]MDQ0051900.1 DNA-binding HxlR family transcriptional regulator [Variovorax boronicumulans]
MEEQQQDPQPAAHPAWNPYLATCPTRQVLDCIADKWAALVVGLLIGGTRRFGELRREIQGVSQKMLTQTLRSLERDGIVRREVYATVPPKVEYSLTPLGESLAATLEELRLWAERNIEDVLRNRAAFDAAAAVASESAPASAAKNR